MKPTDHDPRLTQLARQAVQTVSRERFWAEMAKRQAERSLLGEKPARAAKTVNPSPKPQQDHFLTFIFYYTKLNKQPPTEADIAA